MLLEFSLDPHSIRRALQHAHHNAWVEPSGHQLSVNCIGLVFYVYDRAPRTGLEGRKRNAPPFGHVSIGRWYRRPVGVVRRIAQLSGQGFRLFGSHRMFYLIGLMVPFLLGEARSVGKMKGSTRVRGETEGSRLTAYTSGLRHHWQMGTFP